MHFFEVKDDITQQAVASLGIKPSADEQSRMLRRATNNVAAYSHYLRARELLRHFDKEDNLKARKVSDEALALDPDFVLAQVNLAWTHILEASIFNGDQDVATARELADKALAIDPSSVDALLLLGRIYGNMTGSEKSEQLATYAKAVESSPNNANAAIFLGSGKSFSGKPNEGLPLIERAIRLNPNHPAWYQWTLGWAQYLLGNYKSAITSFEKNIARNPKDAEAYGDLAHTYVKLGRLDDAKTAVTKMLELDDTYTVSRYGKQVGRRIEDASIVEVILEDLRKTGLQE